MFKLVFTEVAESHLTKWKVKEGSRYGEKVVLCEYRNSKLCKLKSEFAGTVKKILIHENEVVHQGDTLALVERCTHATLWRNMCADCGTDLKEEQNIISSAFVAMEHSIPDLLVSEKNAQELGKEDERRLLKSRRLVLLVDLDQTIIHTTNDNIPSNLKDVYHFQLNHGPNNQLWWYHTKFRPHTERFLENISKYYELHICTFGIRPYAHAIANFLDPDKKYFQHRILSRDECFHPTLKTLNLKALFPCGDSMVCIIDDREDVWGSAPNMIRVKPYNFFQGTADINAPPGASKATTNQPNRKAKLCPIARKEKIIKIPIVPEVKRKVDENVEIKDGVKEKEQSTENNLKINKINDEEERKLDEKSCDDEKLILNSDMKSETAKTDDSPTNEKDEVECHYKEIIEWEDEDDYLLHLEVILCRIHKEYYTSYDLQTKTGGENCDSLDLKELIPREKKKILKGCNIIFSGVVPMNQPIESSWAYLLAVNYGANVHINFVEGSDKTTHVVGMRGGTEKIKKAIKFGAHVVNINWLLQSVERWEKVDEQLFSLDNVENNSMRIPYTIDYHKPSSKIKEKPAVIEAQVKKSSKEKQVLTKLTESEKDAMLNEIEEDLSSNSDLENDAPIVKETSKPSEIREDIEDDDDDDDDVNKKLRNEVLKKDFDADEDSSNAESLDNEYPKGWKSLKRKRCKIEANNDTENSSDVSSNSESCIGNISDSESNDSSNNIIDAPL